MEYIFHEKQESSLCAQHCLNALLQGHYFTVVELSALALQLDEEERCACDEDHADNTRGSQNMNESGNFSVQVLSKALEIWSLELVPFLRQSSEAEAARANPTHQRAFICNFREHWFTIRRFGDQWFNLNSTLPAPRLISPTYLTVYLAQLQYEGHSIFFVTGQLPESEADRVITLCPVTEAETHIAPEADTTVRGVEGHYFDPDSHQPTLHGVEDETIMQQVLYSSRVEEDERQLQRALELSTLTHSQEPYYDLAGEDIDLN